MRLFCIGRNYADHAKELNNPLPKAPVLFMKPASALLTNGESFEHPTFSNDIHHELELVAEIGKAGKNIAAEAALGHISRFGLGLDFTARDLQAKCKEKKHPWEIAKAFDHSAPLGTLQAYSNQDLQNQSFELKVNGETKQSGHTSDMIFDVKTLIEFISQYFKLEIGDLIYTGTPAGVGPIKKGDQLVGYLNSNPVLKCDIT